MILQELRQSLRSERHAEDFCFPFLTPLQSKSPPLRPSITSHHQHVVPNLRSPTETLHFSKGITTSPSKTKQKNLRFTSNSALVDPLTQGIPSFRPAAPGIGRGRRAPGPWCGCNSPPAVRLRRSDPAAAAAVLSRGGWE